jgi:hypothetical protein
MRKGIFLLLLFITNGLFFSCKQDKGTKLPVNRMKEVMYDMVCADELYAEKCARDTTEKKKNTNVQLYQAVFAKHKISANEFYDAVKYYQHHPDDYKVLMDSLQSYANQQRNKPISTKLQKLTL